GNDDHDGSFARISCAALPLKLFTQIVTAKFLANRSAGNGEDAAEIRLHQNTYGVPTEFGRQAARGGTDTAFETEGHGSSARADRALVDGAAFGAFDGCEY